MKMVTFTDEEARVVAAYFKQRDVVNDWRENGWNMVLEQVQTADEQRDMRRQATRTQWLKALYDALEKLQNIA